MYEFEVLQDVATIGTTGKALKVVAWGGRAAKLDLRQWRKDGDELKPGKGITLTKEEAQALHKALGDFLAS